MSDARTTVLSAVTKALEDTREQTRSEPREVLVSQGAEDRHELARRFGDEIAALHGQAVIVRDRDQCAAAVTAYLKERGARSVAVQSRPLVTDIAARLGRFEVFAANGQDKHNLARCDGGLLEASSLIADVGAAVVLLENSADRMLPYLPRTCAIVAALSSLYPALDGQAVSSIQVAANSGARGEALIVAGPSCTADIEKLLVLGAHGPEAVAVFIIEQP